MDDSNAKGHELEQHFAGWMKRRLRYTQFKFREKVKGRVSDYGYEVDIKAKKFDPMWDNVRLLGAGLIALALLSAILPQFRSVRYYVEHAVGTVVPSLAPYGLLLLGIVAGVLGVQGRERSVRYTWVECKNTRKPVTRDHVIKLAAYLDDIREHGSVKWKPDDIFFPGGHLKVLHLWPGQTPPPGRRRNGGKLGLGCPPCNPAGGFSQSPALAFELEQVAVVHQAVE